MKFSQLVTVDQAGVDVQVVDDIGLKENTQTEENQQQDESEENAEARETERSVLGRTTELTIG